MIDFIGIGAQKAGTSWVYACLYEHPEICAPVKEIHFFSRPKFAKGRTWYESHFKRCNKHLKTGEFSTSYLYSSKAPERIQELYPDAKLLVILRNPIDRAYSHYRNAVKAGEVPKEMTFDEFRKKEKGCLEQGLYVAQLQNYLRLFKREQIYICIYEDSLEDPGTFIRSVYAFLGVNADFIPSMLHSRVNVARTPRLVSIDRFMHNIAETLRRFGLDRLVWRVRKSRMPDFIRSLNTHEGESTTIINREELQEYYREDVRQLSACIGRNMSKEWHI